MFACLVNVGWFRRMFAVVVVVPTTLAQLRVVIEEELAQTVALATTAREPPSQQSLGFRELLTQR
jgi:hypothetical protein